MPHKQNKSVSHHCSHSTSKMSLDDTANKKAKVEYPNTIKSSPFQQDDTTVSVTLLAGKRLRANDLDVAFTSNECNVVLADGRRWHVRFFREIDFVSSRAQIKQMKIFLKVKKKVPGHWMDLEYIPGQSDIPRKSTSDKEPSQKSTVDKEILSKRSGASGKDRMNQDPPRTSLTNQQNNQSNSEFVLKEEKAYYKQHLDESPKDTDITKSTKKSVTEQNVEHDTSETASTGTITEDTKLKLRESEKPAKNKNTDLSGSNPDGEVIGNIASNGVKLPEANKVVQDKLDLSDLLENDQDKETEEHKNDKADGTDGVYLLNHVKTDFFEKCVAKQNDTVSLTVFVKLIIKESVELHVNGKELVLTFKTRDSKFLSMHQGTDENTTFLWRITVVDELIAAQCSFKVKQSTLDVTLRKQEARRWCALEAVNSKEYAQTSATWKPVKNTAKVTPLPSCHLDVKNKSSSQSKVGFTDAAHVKAGPKKIAVEHSENDSGTTGKVKNEYKGSVLGESSKDNTKKPTCMVSPLKLSPQTTVVAPGFTGLDNMGNTCFMNSVLQVLSNSKELRDYFLDGRFQQELNCDNPLGSGGNLAVEFATLLKILWSGKRHSYAPSNLKKLVAQKKSMFSGFAQHDAQEYMSFLLDGLHEDLNRVQTKPYFEQMDSGGRPDEVVADEFWCNHRKRDDSFLVDLFQGQYKSTLVCPECDKVSVTFDPFMHLPVPLPKRQRLLPVVFMRRDPTLRPIRYMLKLAKDATVENLKEAISAITAVSPTDLRVFEAYRSRIHAFFTRGSSLSAVTSTDKIIVHEVLSEKLAGGPVKEIVMIQRTMRPLNVLSRCSGCRREAKADGKLKRCTGCLRIGYCNSTCQKDDWNRHKSVCRKNPELVGMPFIISLPQSRLTFSHIYELADRYSRYSVDVFQPPQSDIAPTSPASSFEEDPPVFKTETMFSDDDDSADSVGHSVVSNGTDRVLNESLMTHKTTVSASVSSPADLGNCGSSVLNTTATSMDESVATDTTLVVNLPNITNTSTNTAICDMHNVEPSTSKSLESDSSQSKETRAVIPQQKNSEGPAHLFKMKVCKKDGHELPDSTYLKDKGNELLDLTHINFLAVDWINDEKCRPYVMVQTREFDVLDDESVTEVQQEDNRDSNLQQCISLFMQPEVLGAQEAWYCPKCKEHREATKQLSLWRLPTYLIIQLKRFSYRNFLWCDKVDKMVQFPTRGLDMSPYFVGKMPTGQPPPIYDLTGVVNHYGGILGGHYTSYVRTPAGDDWKRSEIGWRLCDDSRVTNCSEDRVVTQAAYVLFYRRRENLPLSTSIPQTVSSESALNDNHSLYTSSENANSETLVSKPNKANSVETLSNTDSGISTSSLFSNDCGDISDEHNVETGDNPSTCRPTCDTLCDVGESPKLKVDSGSPVLYTDMDSVD